MVASEHAIKLMLIRKEKDVQLPVYDTHKRLKDTEMRYPIMEKLAYCMLLTARKLRSYF